MGEEAEVDEAVATPDPKVEIREAVEELVALSAVLRQDVDADSLEQLADSAAIARFAAAVDICKEVAKEIRPSTAWIKGFIKDLEGVLEFEIVDDTIKPKDPALEEWVKPFNGLLAAEKALPDDLTFDDPRFKAIHEQSLQTLITMADGDWIAYCGRPNDNGLQIHMATTRREKKSIVAKTMTKFREKFYATIPKDTDEMSAEDQDYWFNLFKLADEHKAGAKQWQEIGKVLKERGGKEGCSIRRRGHWRNEKQRKGVNIYHVVTPERRLCFHQINRLSSQHNRQLEIFINTQHAAKQYTAQQEAKALEKLHGMVTQEQYDNYTITGTLKESSKSGVEYFIRKLRPTLAFRYTKEGKEEVHRFLAGLCLHPMAYYLDSFAGCLCPTDDVIVLLLWIRGDERRFWGKANHHPLGQVELGLP